MTQDMILSGNPWDDSAQDTASAHGDDRHSLLIEVLMGGFAASETWIETMLDRITARP